MAIAFQAAGYIHHSVGDTISYWNDCYAHSNMSNFHLRFEMYEDKEDPLPIVHPVLASDIEENYQQIR